MRQRIRVCTTHDGARIAYSTAGTGPPVVWTGSWLTHLELDWEGPIWRHWIDTLAERHTVVRYDTRGSGLSDRDLGNPSITTWIGDLDAIVDDLGLNEFALLGVCQGSAIAVAYAAHRPARVNRLALYGGYVRGALARDPDSDAAKQARALTDMIQLGWGQHHGAFRELFARIFMPEGPPEHVRFLGDLQREAVTPANAARLWTAFQSLDVRDMASRLDLPVLVAHVRGDAMIPLEEGERLASLIPGAELMVLEGQNHILTEDDDAWPRFADALHAFLDGDAEATAQDRFPELTRRERDVLCLVAQGCTNSEIATELDLRPKTIRNHVSNIIDKLGVTSRSQAIVEARRAGLE